MNRLQYIQTLRIYWITRDVYPPNTRKFGLGYMLQSAPPWWKGKGVQVIVFGRLIQVGILLRKGSGLLEQLGGRDLDVPAKELRSWGVKKAKG